MPKWSEGKRMGPDCKGRVKRGRKEKNRTREEIDIELRREERRINYRGNGFRPRKRGKKCEL